VTVAFGARHLDRTIQEARRSEAIAELADELYRWPDAPVVGNKQGDVTVVVFLDYNSPNSRRDAPDLAKLIANDGNVRLVVKALPGLARSSEGVARVALAAARQGKYPELHDALFAAKGRLNKAKALDLAAGIGLDRTRLEKDILDRKIAKTLAINRRVATKLGVKDVPFYLVGDLVVDEGPDDLYSELTENVADIRENGCRAKC
jgi:protein-disulfide isomerase